MLQRIGLCFAAAGLLATADPRARRSGRSSPILLLGYWALLAAGGSFAPWDNLASRIDAALLGPMAYQFDAASGRGHDPEGLLSTLARHRHHAAGRARGPMAARRRDEATAAGRRRSRWLAGFAWSQWFPFNKNLWTSSYVLWTAGWAMLALALCHALIDDRKWPALGRRFGVNAIAAYVGSAAMVYVFAGLGVVGADLSRRLQRLDDAALRALPAVAGFRARVRGVVVGRGSLDGPPPVVSQALRSLSILLLPITAFSAALE